MATLGWSGVDEEDVSVDAGRIDAITSTPVTARRSWRRLPNVEPSMSGLFSVT